MAISKSTRSRLILAGDIGGTKTHLALYRTQRATLTVAREELFQSRHFSSLDLVVETFLKGHREKIERACFGIAGPVIDGRSETTNLPWVVDARQLKKRFRISKVALINDLEATAYGALGLAKEDCYLLNRGQSVAQGNQCVVAAGTGLGESILFWDGSAYQPCATEGGHTDFAPRTPGEIELLEYLLARFSRVSYERVLSGPGLLVLYKYFKHRAKGQEPPWLRERLSQEDPSAVITEVALTGKVQLCIDTVNLFVEIYGAEAGNLALKSLATGGVYLGGGIAPKILKLLRGDRFMNAFCAKGRYASLMSRIPIRVIMNEQTALLGAARFANSRL